MKKRWGLNDFQNACSSCYTSLSTRRFKSIQENDRKSLLLFELINISKLTNHHIRFFPKSQQKTIKRLQKCIVKEIWERQAHRLISFFYWRGLDSQSPSTYLKDQIFRYVYDIQEASLDIQNFPLHQAVFHHDLYKIHKLCAGEDSDLMYTDINKLDPLSNTPLMLAVKMKKHEAALVLIDHGADPKYRKSSKTLSALEQALGQQDVQMIRILVTGYLRQIRQKWLGHNNDFLEALRRMKDFSMTMRWECKSSIIPFVKKFTPSDVYQIYKRGENIRVDLTLINWNSLKSKRGNISLWYNGRMKRLKIFDHKSRVIRDFDTEPSEASIDSAVEKLMKSKKFSNDISISEVKLEPDTNWRGESQVEVINNWKCTKQKLTCSIGIEKEKREVFYDLGLDKVHSFQEYFQYALQFVSEESASKSQKILENREKKHVFKQLNASLWLCDNFPLTLCDFLPLLELLGSFSKNAQHLCTFFQNGNLLGNGFPVKALIPVYASVKLIVYLDSITMKRPKKSYFSFPIPLRGSEESTAKIEEWTSDYFYQCDVSCSEDENIVEAQKLFLSLKSLESTPLITDMSIDDFEDLEDEEEMPEVSILEVHHRLPEPRSYNRNSLPGSIYKKQELFKKVKSYAMSNEKPSKSDVDIIL